MEDLWNALLDAYSPKTIDIVGTFIIQTTFFWGLSLCYLSLDVIAPEWSLKHKLQKERVSIQQIIECLKVVVQNQVIASSVQYVTFKIICKVLSFFTFIDAYCQRCNFARHHMRGSVLL